MRRQVVPGSIKNIDAARGVILKLCFFALIALTSFATAETPTRSAVPELPPQSKPIDDVLVPVPREVFESLDKFTNSNWGSVQRRGLARWKPHGDPPQAALLLGALIAEGFIAVEAKDADQVKKLGSAVLKVAAAVGVEKSVLRRSRAIIEDAERSDWEAVRKEWDGVFADVEAAMAKLHSGQLSQLVSVGGWLRGTEALTVLLLQNYSADRAELLRQPASLDYFEQRMAGMNGELRSKTLVAKMQQGIRRIRPLVRSDGRALSEKTVKEIGAIAKELVDEIDVRKR